MPFETAVGSGHAMVPPSIWHIPASQQTPSRHAALPLQVTWQLPPPQCTGSWQDACPEQVMADASATAVTEPQLPWPLQPMAQLAAWQLT
jgi:hypothetical protein